jgi:hypothetical protein
MRSPQHDVTWPTTSCFLQVAIWSATATALPCFDLTCHTSNDLLQCQACLWIWIVQWLEQCTQSMCPSWTRSLEEATVLGRLTTLKTWDLTAKSWNSATMLVKQSVVSTGWQHGKAGGGFQTFQHAVIVPRCSTNSISKIIYGLTVIAAQGPWTRVALEAHPCYWQHPVSRPIYPQPEH